VAARYRDTDALAAANALEVRRALDAAVVAAGKAQAAAQPPATASGPENLGAGAVAL
jgi:hypothetical protein